VRQLLSGKKRWQQNQNLQVKQLGFKVNQNVKVDELRLICHDENLEFNVFVGFNSVEDPESGVFLALGSGIEKNPDP
jgi:hypothetical protein